MDRAFDPPAVAIRVLRHAGEAARVPVYRGVSFCDAVRRAAGGQTLRVLPGSVEVCQWAPVVLGLKEPEGRFEQGLLPRLAAPVDGLLLAPLDDFPGEPEVVMVRAGLKDLKTMIVAAGPDALWKGHGDRLDRSALPTIESWEPDRTQGLHGARQALIGGINRPLAALARSARWRALTYWLFRSRAITASFDAVISRTLSDMSVCRNSTAIPLLTGRANVSYFCSGGITWGRNNPEHLTSGWPWHLYRRLGDQLGRPTGIGDADG